MNREFSVEEREKFINRVEENDRIFQQGDNWERYLVSDYWKNWQKKIRTLQSEEANFFAVRLSKLRSDIIWDVNYYKFGKYDADYIKKLTEIKEKELQNITRKEWEFVEQISGSLGNFFQKGIDDYRNLSKEELIREISELKAEIERLKTIKIGGDWGKRKVKEFSRELKQQLVNSQVCLDSLQGVNSKNNFPIFLVIGIIGLIALLTGLFTYKLKKTKK